MVVFMVIKKLFCYFKIKLSIVIIMEIWYLRHDCSRLSSFPDHIVFFYDFTTVNNSTY